MKCTYLAISTVSGFYDNCVWMCLVATRTSRKALEAKA